MTPRRRAIVVELLVRLCAYAYASLVYEPVRVGKRDRVLFVN